VLCTVRAHAFDPTIDVERCLNHHYYKFAIRCVGQATACINTFLGSFSYPAMNDCENCKQFRDECVARECVEPIIYPDTCKGGSCELTPGCVCSTLWTIDKYGIPQAECACHRQRLLPGPPAPIPVPATKLPLPPW
jgi:hypothetical protein